MSGEEKLALKEAAEYHIDGVTNTFTNVQLREENEGFLIWANSSTDSDEIQLASFMRGKTGFFVSVIMSFLVNNPSIGISVAKGVSSDRFKADIIKKIINEQLEE